MTTLRIVLAFLFVFLTGCDTTGGTLGGLLPAPKFLKGDIRDGVYTAQDKLFSIKVPHKEDSYEYKYMQVKEQYSNLGAYVSFGPAAFDQSIYRIEIAKRTSQSIELNKAVAEKIIESYKTQLANGYGTLPQEISSSQEKINDKTAFYWKLSQKSPSGSTSATITHEAYVLEFQKGAAVVWVQLPESVPSSSLGARAFVESLLMN